MFWWYGGNDGSGGGSSVGLDPVVDYATIGTLILNLDAKNLSTITTDGSNQTTEWRDTSGNDYHAVPPSGVDGPLSGTRTYFGKNVLDFTAGTTTRLLNLSSHSRLLNLYSENFTMYVVGASDNAGQSGSYVGAEGAAGADRMRVGMRAGNAAIFMRQPAQYVGWIKDRTPHIFTATRVGTSGGVIRGWQDDVEITSGTTTHTDTATLVSMTIGGINNTNGDDLDGFIGQILIYEGIHDDETRRAIWDSLAYEWGIAMTAHDYDVVVLAGQSNMVGYSNETADPILDALHPQIFMLERSGDGNHDKKVIAARLPLSHIAPQGDVSLGFTLAKNYCAQYPDRRLILVPVARGSTGFNDGEWTVTTGANYTDAVARVNAVMAFGTGQKTMKSIHWQQGEDDVSMTEASYGAALDAMIAGMRADFDGASSATPFICGGFAPNFNFSNYDQILDALQDLPNRVSNTGYVSTAGLSDRGDNIHFDAVSLRTLGERHFAKLQELE